MRARAARPASLHKGGVRHGPRGARARGHRAPRLGPRSSAVGRRLAGRRWDAGDPVFRIWDPLVVHAKEQLAEGVLDPRDVAQGQVALVELALRETIADDALDHRAD